MKNKKQNALSALTMSALAIPGVTKAEVAPETSVISYRYTNYQEADIPAERLIGGSAKRYTIDVHQFSLLAPVRDQYSIKADLTYESLSGASPWSSSLNSSGQTEVLMSGATIEESRIDFSVSPKRYFKDGTLGTTVAMSEENDYKSLAFGVDGTIELYNSHTTLVGSLSLSNDQINPTPYKPTNWPSREEADGEKKQTFSIYEGISQIIDKHRAIQVGVGYTRHTGYLSDPYKGDLGNNDRRPERREMYTLTTQYRQYLSWLNGAGLHLDYRLYDDSWKVRSHTFDIALWQNVQMFGENFTFAPSFRFYMQNAADFYSVDPADTSNEFYSHDARLSAYGAMTFGLESQYHWKDGTITFGFKNYQSNEDWAFIDGDDTETPSLVNFTAMSIGLDYKF